MSLWYSMKKSAKTEAFGFQYPFLSSHRAISNPWVSHATTKWGKSHTHHPLVPSDVACEGLSPGISQR